MKIVTTITLSVYLTGDSKDLFTLSSCFVADQLSKHLIAMICFELRIA